jgi:DNA uptake protein ComE-like DNA-binding protein
MKLRLPERIAAAARTALVLAANVAAAAVLVAVATEARAEPAPSATAAPAKAAPGKAAAAAFIDINSATPEQLQTLPGIGRDEAERIVSARPYRTKADLATREVLPTGVYLAIRHRIAALPPAPKRAAKGQAS